MAGIRTDLQQRDQLATLLEAIPDGVVKLDMRGCVQESNAAAQRFFVAIAAESAPDLFQIHSLRRLRARDNHGQLLTLESSPPDRLLRGETLAGLSAPIIRIPTLQGQEMYVQISGAPLQDELAQIIGAVVILRDVTEYTRRRRYLEEMLLQGVIEQRRLREREERALHISALATDFAYAYCMSTDGHLQLLWMGDSFFEATGYTSEDLTVTDWSYAPFYRVNDEAALQARLSALQAGRPDVREWGLIASDGTVRQVRDSCHPVYDEASKVTYVYGAVRDLTERKDEGQQVYQLMRQMTEIFEAITDGVVIYDRDGQVLQFNSALRELVALLPGLDKQSSLRELIAALPFCDTHGELLPTERTPLYRVLHGEVLQGATSQDVLMTQGQQSDRDIYLNVSGAPIRDLDDELIGAVLILRDVTTRLRQEQRTRRALDALLEISEVLMQFPEQKSSEDEATNEAAYETRQQIATRMLTVTCDLLLQYPQYPSQRSAEGLQGSQVAAIVTFQGESEHFQPVAVTGMTAEQKNCFWSDLSLHSLPDYFWPAQCELLYAGEVVVLDMTRLPAPDLPSYGLTQVLVAPLTVAGQCLGLLALDYTEVEPSYPLHEAFVLLKVIGKLAALVIERERLIHERTIARAQSMAEREANRQKDEFLGMASHELRIPLATIKASIQMTRRQLRLLHTASEVKIEDVRRQVEEMLDRGERQVAVESRLIGDLLDVSRMQGNLLQLQPKLCNLLDVVRNVVADVRTGSMTRHIAIYEPQEDMFPVVVDVERIGQVLTNYLNNAIKYSPMDKRIVVSLGIEGDVVRVAVQDEGPGLSLEARERIWTRFYQSPERIIYSGSSGLGLGLYICQTIVHQHNGQVGVESKPGTGSTFWFTLPLARS